MSPKKQTQDSSQLSDKMRQLYDTFMFNVESDLMSYMVPNLEEIYQDETKEEHRARMQRYAEAFEMFAAFLDDANIILEEQSLGIKKMAMAEYAEKQHTEDADTMESLEKKIKEDSGNHS